MKKKYQRMIQNDERMNQDKRKKIVDQRAWYKKGRRVLLGITLLIVMAGVVNSYQESCRLQKSIATKILRFHVLANSDTQVDQELKLKVRDAVGDYLSKDLREVQNLSECEQVVTDKLPEIIQVANQTIQEAGYTYETTAVLTTTEFPVKTYGEYTFPAGTYEALEITIGNGEGHNWWCVLYPNMCFQGSVYEVVEEDAKESLEEVLTPEEYEAVFNGDHYEVHFKIVDELKEIFAEK